MSCYDALAPWYDSLTGDVPYGAIADFYESVFSADGGEFRLLLDLCCGTGSMTWELAGRGYEMIAADRSVDMLMQAQAKQGPCRVQPLFLCQAAEGLDLYGTVDAAVCCLDGSLDGQIFVDEKEDVLCLWRADFDEDSSALVYGMDLFTKRGTLWERNEEEHIEYAHTPETLCALLEQAGFDNVRQRVDGPQGEAGRLYIIARRNENG